MTLRDALEEIMKGLVSDLQKSLIDQGHNLTGRLHDSIVYEVDQDGTTMVGRVLIEEYGVFVEAGVTADKIPFDPSRKKGQGGGGKSQYIQGLVRFWEHRGLSGREAVSAAFATARIHKREGMPSSNSFGYSSTGERTGFIRTVLDDSIPKISKMLEEKYLATVQLQLADAFRSERSTVK